MGITVDEMATICTNREYVALMYQSPTRAKRLYFDVIPKNVDEYIILIKSTMQNQIK